MKGSLFTGSITPESFALLYPSVTSRYDKYFWEVQTCHHYFSVAECTPTEDFCVCGAQSPHWALHTGTCPLLFCMGKEWDIKNFDFFINETKTPHIIYRREYAFFYFSEWFSDSSYLTFPLLAFIFTDNITFGICKQILMVRIADRPLCSLSIVGDYCSLQKNQDWVLLLYQCHSSAAHTAGTNAGPHFGMKAANQKKQWL